MKKNRLALLLTLVLLLLTLTLVVTNRTSTLDRKETSFAVSDTAAITKIFIADMDTNQVLLERKGLTWNLNGQHPAQSRKIDLLLNTMMKLRVRAPVSQAGHNTVISRMSGISVKVEVYQIVPLINLFDRIKLFPREKKVKTYYVGDATKDNMGTFMLMEGAKTAYIVYLPGFRGFVSSRFTAFADDWRDHVVFRHSLGNIRSVKMEFNADKEQGFLLEAQEMNNYKLTRLSDMHQTTSFDTLRVLNYLTSFSDIRFEALLNNKMPRPQKDSILASPFMHRITLTDMSGKQTVVTTFEKRATYDPRQVDYEFVPVDLDRLYGLVNDDKDFVLMQYYTFDKVLRPLDYLLGY
jgi:hypothetical protein